MGKALNMGSNLLGSRSMSARYADGILDHLSVMIRETGRDKDRVERIHGMDLQYWTGRINAVIEETDQLSSQHERAKCLMVRLLSSDRA